MNNPDVRNPTARHAEPASPVLPANPGEPKGLVKILLSQAASDALKAAGTCLCVSQYVPYPCAPEVMGRQALVCSPITTVMLNDIHLLIEGKARVVKIKPKKLAPPATISHDYLTR